MTASTTMVLHLEPAENPARPNIEVTHLEPGATPHVTLRDGDTTVIAVLGRYWGGDGESLAQVRVLRAELDKIEAVLVARIHETHGGAAGSFYAEGCVLCPA